jgi:antitoxin component YwqK of YwqJK toxin-antitoxin module
MDLLHQFVGGYRERNAKRMNEDLSPDCQMIDGFMVHGKCMKKKQPTDDPTKPPVCLKDLRVITSDHMGVKSEGYEIFNNCAKFHCTFLNGIPHGMFKVSYFETEQTVFEGSIQFFQFQNKDYAKFESATIVDTIEYAILDKQPVVQQMMWFQGTINLHGWILNGTFFDADLSKRFKGELCYETKMMKGERHRGIFRAIGEFKSDSPSFEFDNYYLDGYGESYKDCFLVTKGLYKRGYLIEGDKFQVNRLEWKTVPHVSGKFTPEEKNTLVEGIFYYISGNPMLERGNDKEIQYYDTPTKQVKRRIIGLKNNDFLEEFTIEGIPIRKRELVDDMMIDEEHYVSGQKKYRKIFYKDTGVLDEEEYFESGKIKRKCIGAEGNGSTEETFYETGIKMEEKVIGFTGGKGVTGEGKYAKYFHDGTASIEYTTLGGKKHGEYKERWDNKLPKQYLIYNNGKLHGQQHYFNEAGVPERVLNYNNGRPSGDQQFFEKNKLVKRINISVLETGEEIYMGVCYFQDGTRFEGKFDTKYEPLEGKLITKTGQEAVFNGIASLMEAMTSMMSTQESAVPQPVMNIDEYGSSRGGKRIRTFE